MKKKLELLQIALPKVGIILQLLTKSVTLSNHFYTDVDECADNNGGCSEFATCINVPDSFNCICNTGYTGDGFTCTGKTLILSAANIYNYCSR